MAPASSTRLRIFRKRRDEDHRCAAAARNQYTLQFDPAQARHLNIRDDAGRVAHAVRLQVVLGRGKCCGAITKRSYETIRCHADRRIIVDDRDHGSFRQISLPGRGIVIRRKPATSTKVGFSCRQRSVIYTKVQMSYLFPCRIPSVSAILTRSANERAPIFRMTLPR